VFGCAVLATGIWMKLEAHKYLDIDPANPVTFHVSIFFMSMGVAIALVGLLSCYCTLSGNPILLYLVRLFIVLFLCDIQIVGIFFFFFTVLCFPWSSFDSADQHWCGSFCLP